MLLVSTIIVTHNRRLEVLQCIDSVLRSTYKEIEVIVVDNNSTDGTKESLRLYCDKIKLIESSKNLYAGGGRRLGYLFATGDFYLFVDDDNIVASDMIENLIKINSRYTDIGISGPMTCSQEDPYHLCWTNNSINLITSRTTIQGIREVDCGQFDEILEVGHIPNIFMLSKSVWNLVGGIDKDYVMHYEESDLAEKVKRISKRIVLVPSAYAWHNLNKSFQDNPEINYYISRNRILFMRKNSSGIKLVIFLLVFSPMFLIYNLIQVLKNKKYNLVKPILKGFVDAHRSINR